MYHFMKTTVEYHPNTKIFGKFLHDKVHEGKNEGGTNKLTVCCSSWKKSCSRNQKCHPYAASLTPFGSEL